MPSSAARIARTSASTSIRRALDETEAAFGAMHGSRLVGKNARLVSSVSAGSKTFVGHGSQCYCVIGQTIDLAITRS